MESNLSHELDACWDWVRERTQCPTPAGSMPFCIAGVPCGLLTPHSRAVWAQLPAAVTADFVVSDEGLNLIATDPEAALTRVAQALWERRALPEWRDEKLDIVANDDIHHVLSRAERGIFRFFGLLTQCVHAVGADESGKLWGGLRAPTKQIDPNLLDTLSGGLVSAGESWTVALARETSEEAGLDPADYDCGDWSVWEADREVDKGFMRELTVSCRVHLKPHARPHNRDGEVALFRAFSPAELIELIRAEKVTLEAALSFLSLLAPRAQKQSLKAKS